MIANWASLDWKDRDLDWRDWQRARTCMSPVWSSSFAFVVAVVVVVVGIVDVAGTVGLNSGWMTKRLEMIN